MMKFAILIIAIVAYIISQLSFTPKSLVADQNATIMMNQNLIYRRLSDFLDYDKWMAGVYNVDSGDLPRNVYIGAEFTTGMEMGYLGLIHHRSVVSGFEPNRYFSFITENWPMTKTEFTIEPTSKPGKCKVNLRVSSRRENPFFTYILNPILTVYYRNWATQSLVSFKITFN